MADGTLRAGRTSGMSTELKDWLSPLATLVSVIVGFGGVVWSLRAARLNVVWGLQAAKSDQERKQAFDAYDAYLRNCFEYPNFANGDLAAKPVSIPNNYKEGSDDFYKYEWFVARLLAAAEQILEVVGPNEAWEKTIRAQVKKHSRYIRTTYVKSGFYDGRLGEIIAHIKEPETAPEKGKK